jgi:hypothetical protein
VEDDELRDLQERVALIEEMSSHPGWTMLTDRAHATLRSTQQSIINGRLDLDTYRNRCGFIEGAFFILNLPGAVRSELDEEMFSRGEQEDADAEA